MAKDPAFLFYPGDWMGGTIGMSFEEKGAYLELLLFQFNRGAFTEKQALSLIRDSSLWELLKEKFVMENGVYINKKLKEEKEKRQKYTESRSLSRKKSDEDNVRIYIVRDNVRKTYKIGSSVNPTRRYNELSNQKNPAIMADQQGNRDITLVWYSHAVLRKEEGKLHKQFENRHISGEWFALLKEDLDLIFSTYKGTYVERTINRTENENENESINESINRNRDRIGGAGEKKGTGQLIPQMQELWISAFPLYTPDKELDFPALRTIADFTFKNAGIKNGYGNVDNEIKVLNTFQLIADQVNREKFWINKPLATIAKNIQEFYNNIKNPKIEATNGKYKSNGAATREELNRLYMERFGKE